MGSTTITDTDGNQFSASSTDNSGTTTTKPASPDPAAAMLFFFIVTSIYCLIGIFRGGGSPQSKIILQICYILFIITGEYFINLNLSNAMCGVNQWRAVLYITVVPWLLIFGVLHVFLTIFPGWLSPFSNTFGYLVARLMGLPDLMKDIVAPVAEGETQRAILSVTTDDSLLINQFTTETAIEEIDKTTGQRKKMRPIFDSAWDKLQKAKIINTFSVKENETYRSKLYNFIEMKYTISEYVWNMLSGLLVTSVSYNYILSTGCEKSVTDMKERYDAYEAAEKAKKNKKKEFQGNQPNYVEKQLNE